MDSLDTFLHPQAWAAALALADLSIAWMVVATVVVGLIRERRRSVAAMPPSVPVARRGRFA